VWWQKQSVQLAMSETCSNTCDESRDEQIRELYSDLALHPEKDFGWGKGVDNVRALGYDAAWLERLPLAVWESSSAVGNPFSVGPIHLGETVVDLGCGAGADVCVAALLVGSRGRVMGVDVTPAMVEKARANWRKHAPTSLWRASETRKFSRPTSQSFPSRMPGLMSSFPMALSTFLHIRRVC
jgi:SAM-dependent methyltransferase